LLENLLGEVVWPPPEEDVARIPAQERMKQSRRKPREADPQGYRLLLPWKRG
jgi:hypothetical protein